MSHDATAVFTASMVPCSPLVASTMPPLLIGSPQPRGTPQGATVAVPGTLLVPRPRIHAAPLFTVLRASNVHPNDSAVIGAQLADVPDHPLLGLDHALVIEAVTRHAQNPLKDLDVPARLVGRVRGLVLDRVIDRLRRDPATNGVLAQAVALHAAVQAVREHPAATDAVAVRTWLATVLADLEAIIVGRPTTTSCWHARTWDDVCAALSTPHGGFLGVCFDATQRSHILRVVTAVAAAGDEEQQR